MTVLCEDREDPPLSLNLKNLQGDILQRMGRNYQRNNEFRRLEMDVSKEQWVVQCQDGVHIVSLCYLDYSYANLLIDENVIAKIKTNHFFNYEYKFNVKEKQCSIVKLVTDKSFGFVSDGEYQNKPRKYNPVTKVPKLTWVFLIIDIIISIALITLLLFRGFSIESDMVWILSVLTYTSFIIYCMRVVCNAPVVFKNPKKNLALRCFVVSIIELVFIAIAIGMFYLFSS